ncbi:MAG: hypothetical protein AB7P01_16335 [Bacteroidia bacterium]
MKNLLLVLSFLVAEFSFAQESYKSDTVVKGIVSTKRNGKVIGMQSKIVVVGTDGTSVEKITDENGRFYFFNTEIKPEHAFVITCKPVDKPLYPYYANKTGKFITKGIKEKDLPISYKFEIDPSGCRGLLPSFYFSNNSFTLDSIGLNAIDGLVETLNDNPTIVMELGGRAIASELNPAELAGARSEFFKKQLIERCIENERIITANYSDTLYHVINWYDLHFELGDTLTPSFISKLSDPIMIDYANSLNRMIQLKVVRSDYVPKTK